MPEQEINQLEMADDFIGQSHGAADDDNEVIELEPTKALQTKQTGINGSNNLTQRPLRPVQGPIR